MKGRRELLGAIMVALVFSGVIVAKADKLIDVSFNDDQAAQSLVNRGTLTATGVFTNDASYSSDRPTVNTFGYSGLFADDGDRDAVVFDNLPGLNNLGAMTITAWVKCNAPVNGDVRTIAGNYYYVPPPYNEGSQFFMIWNKPRFLVSGKSLESATVLPQDTWVFLAATYDGPTKAVVLYRGDGSSLDVDVSGTLALTATDTGSSSLDFMIGSSPNPADTNPFVGGIDDVRIYNEVLDQAAISNIMQEADGVLLPLVDMSFNDSEGAQSLVNRGTLTATGAFENDATYSSDHPTVNYAGYSALFADDDDRDAVSLGNLPGLNNLGAMTITAWVKCNAPVNDDVRTIAGNYYYVPPPYNEGSQFFMIWTKPRFLVSGKSVASATVLPQNTWVFLAATYDGPTKAVVLYRGDGSSLNVDVSGTLALTATDTGSSSLDFMIGSSPNPADTNPFVGGIDDVRIYNEVLDQAAISHIMQTSDMPPPPAGTIIILK